MVNPRDRAFWQGKFSIFRKEGDFIIISKEGGGRGQILGTKAILLVLNTGLCDYDYFYTATELRKLMYMSTSQ